LFATSAILLQTCLLSLIVDIFIGKVFILFLLISWKCVKNSMHTINENIKGVSPIKNKHHIKNNHKYLPL
jgi:hypothetical protein